MNISLYATLPVFFSLKKKNNSLYYLPVQGEIIFCCQQQGCVKLERESMQEYMAIHLNRRTIMLLYVCVSIFERIKNEEHTREEVVVKVKFLTIFLFSCICSVCFDDDVHLIIYTRSICSQLKSIVIGLDSYYTAISKVL